MALDSLGNLNFFLSISHMYQISASVELKWYATPCLLFCEISEFNCDFTVNGEQTLIHHIINGCGYCRFWFLRNIILTIKKYNFAKNRQVIDIN